jgi:dTDP-4-dehydrorhamnose 3,5-epimerase
MELTPLGITGAWLAESPLWPDERGYFREWFKHEEILKATGIDFSVKQSNISLSNKGVIRGIHYSIATEGQAKWITCISGAILDVIVDIRPDSPTFRKIEYVDLKGGEGRAILVGKGLGHGFMALEDQTTVSYLLSSPYSPEFEFEIQPTDPAMKIDWQFELLNGVSVVLSTKDASAPTLGEQAAKGKLP